MVLVVVAVVVVVVLVLVGVGDGGGVGGGSVDGIFQIFNGYIMLERYWCSVHWMPVRFERLDQLQEFELGTRATV